MPGQIENPMPIRKDLSEDLKPLPKPNVVRRGSASETPWTPEEIKGLRLNPVPAGIGRFMPAAIDDQERVVNCVHAIAEDGVKQTLMNIPHLLRVSFQEPGEAPNLVQSDFSRS